MKKVFSIIVVTTALSLSSFAVPPAVLPLPAAAYSYKSGLIETFDSMQMSTKAPMLNGQTLWSVFANGVEFAQNLIVSTNDTWGGETKGFNAGTGTDRMLAFGKTGGMAENSFLIAGFSNETGKDLTEIELYYDLECCWVRYTGSQQVRSASLLASISTDGVTWNRLPALDATVSNTNANQALTWLSDAEMDRQSLSKRNIGGIISLSGTVPPIKPGQKFYIRWATDYVSSCKNMTYGIDNLRTFVDCVPQLAVPPISGTGTNTVSFTATSGKYYTLLSSTSMTGTFTPVPGCVRLTETTGKLLSLSQTTDGDIGFYKVLIEDK